MVRHLFELFTRNQTRGISHGKLSKGMCICRTCDPQCPWVYLKQIWGWFVSAIWPPFKKSWIQQNFSDDHTTRYQPGTNVFLGGGNQAPSTFWQPCFTLRKCEKKSLCRARFLLQLYPSTNDSSYREVIHHLSDSGEEIRYKQASDLRTADVHEILRAFVTLQ